MRRRACKRIGNLDFEFQSRRRDHLHQVAEIENFHRQTGYGLPRTRHLLNETLEGHQTQRTFNLSSVYREGMRYCWFLQSKLGR